MTVLRGPRRPGLQILWMVLGALWIVLLARGRLGRVELECHGGRLTALPPVGLPPDEAKTAIRTWWNGPKPAEGTQQRRTIS